MEGFAAAAEDGGVAGLEAESGGVGGDIGARFIDDDDDTDGSANLLEVQAIWPGALVEDAAYGIGECGDVAKAGGHGGDSLWVEAEAIEHGG